MPTSHWLVAQRLDPGAKLKLMLGVSHPKAGRDGKGRHTRCMVKNGRTCGRLVQRLDGKPTRLYVANHAFRAVVVPAGNHQIDFVYRPRSFVIGAVTSLAALIAVGLTAALLTLRRNRIRGGQR